MRFLMLLPLFFAFITCGPPDDPNLSPSLSGGNIVSVRGGSPTTTGGAAPSTGGKVFFYGGGGISNTGGRKFDGGSSGGYIFIGGTGGVSVPNNNPSCMADIITNGYICNGMSCASCLDNTTSLEDKCRKMVDCIQASWPCAGNCWLECFNKAGGSGVLDSCVKKLQNAACMVPGCGATPAGPATDGSVPSSDASVPSSDASVPTSDGPPSVIDAPEPTVDAPAVPIDAESFMQDAG